MQFYKDSAETELSIMISLMLTYSDNVTSIWNQELAGGGVEINRIMDQLGLVNTKVNSRTTGREQLWRKYGWGQTTPKEIASLMHLIRSGKVFNPQLSDKMYRYLKNQFYNERSLSQIPAEIATASKTGSVDDARGEVVYVHAPSGDYVFSVLTKNNKDQSWTDENEAEKNYAKNSQHHLELLRAKTSLYRISTHKIVAKLNKHPYFITKENDLMFVLQFFLKAVTPQRVMC